MSSGPQSCRESEEEARLNQSAVYIKQKLTGLADNASNLFVYEIKEQVVKDLAILQKSSLTEEQWTAFRSLKTELRKILGVGL